MVVRRRRRAIPPELTSSAPPGAVRIQETWPDGTHPGAADPDRLDWIDADGNRLVPKTRYRRGNAVDDNGVPRPDAPIDAVRFVERYTAFVGELWPAEPDHIDWINAEGQVLG